MPPATIRLSGTATRTPEQPISFFMQQALENPGLISLAAGLVDETSLPTAEVAATLAEIMAELYHTDMTACYSRARSGEVRISIGDPRRAAAQLGFRAETTLADGLATTLDLPRALAKPNMIYSSKARVESDLSRNALYVKGIASLCKQYNLQGWEEPYAKLKTQLAAYDDWVRATILPKARPDFRQPPELYALSLEFIGIDIPPADLAGIAHQRLARVADEIYFAVLGVMLRIKPTVGSADV